MLTDIFKESPVYYWLTDEAREEGLAQGREEARQREQEARQKEQQALEGFRQIAVALVSERFPKLTRLVKKQVYLAEDQARLQQMILKVNSVQDATEMTTLLLALDEEEQDIS